MHLVFDAAYPPETAPPGVSGVMGYLGGPRATRAWTLREWQRFANLRQFPIYVCDVSGNPVEQGTEAAQLARMLGWSAKLAEPSRRVIVLDLETAQAPAFYRTAAAQVSLYGFVPVAYGSLSTVLGNAAVDVIAADWDNVPEIPAGQTIHGSQYRANVPAGNTAVDLSLFDDWLMMRGGIGPRK